jgi:hypothetical protein
VTTQKLPSQQVVVPNLQAPTAHVPVWQNETGFYFTQGSSCTPWAQLRTQQDPTQLFLDTFNLGTIDPNLWVQATSGGSISPVVGSCTISSGTTANQYARLQSVTTFQAQEPGWLMFTGREAIENPTLTTGYRAWGFFTSPGSPTIATSVTDAVIFEIRIDGKLYAATYNSGTRNFVADLSAATGNGAQPSDGKTHKYYIFFRPDLTYYCIDSIDNVVAFWNTGASGPDVNSLPQARLAISNTGTAVTIVENGTSIGNTVRNNMTLSDFVYGFRQQRVLAGGEVLINNAQAIYPNAPTNVTSAAADTAITAANGNRRMLIVSNDSTSKLYLLVDPSGAGVSSATNYTYVVGPGATFEFPNPISTARVRGIWSAANGSAGVTDISQTTTLGGS